MDRLKELNGLNELHGVHAVHGSEQLLGPKRPGMGETYRHRFEEVFGEKPTAQDVAKAIAAFARTLMSGNSAFDRFERGELVEHLPSKLNSQFAVAATRGRRLA